MSEGQRLTSSQLPRQGVLPASIMESAQTIIAGCRSAKTTRCAIFTEIRQVVPESFSVDSGAMDKALDVSTPHFWRRWKSRRSDSRFPRAGACSVVVYRREDGTILGVKVTPVPSAGIYVPGGRAQYPSTVLMNAVPAKVAGVKRIVMVTPPQKDGGISPYTLAAAKVAGVDEIYAVGGAQAIAALAYGTQSIPRVAKITGPGNAYVAAAKRLVSGMPASIWSR
ncbi:MAG: histidinol dehydrogenase [Eggerthellaceae bacterium]